MLSNRILLLGSTVATLVYLESSNILHSFGFHSFLARSALYGTITGIALIITLLLFDYEEWQVNILCGVHGSTT